MPRKWKRANAIGAVAIALMLCGTVAAKAQAGTKAGANCGRACLSGYITQYLDALVAHDPHRLPTAPNVRFTENGVAIPLGEALWVSNSGLGDYRQDYLDTEAQQAATIVSLTENGKPALMSLRLRIEHGRITEVETVLNRFNAAAPTMRAPDPLWAETEPTPSRLTRAQLAAGAEGYLRAVAASDSQYVHFNPKSCIRFENTTVMALAPDDVAPGPLIHASDAHSWPAAVEKTVRLGCAKQLDTGIYGFITSYDNARFPVIDVERQVVFGQWNFRRRGLAKGVTLDGAFYPFGDSMHFPNENLLGEAFKFRDRGITRVQGVFLNSNVYKAGTGWPGGKDGPVSMRQ